MLHLNALQKELYRIWLVRPENWAPKGQREATPLWHTAIQAMDDTLLTADESLAYLEVMNERLRVHRGALWGIRVPIRLLPKGDLEVAQRFMRDGQPGRERWLRANANSTNFPNFANCGEGCA
jgi:hypothetical protein